MRCTPLVLIFTLGSVLFACQVNAALIAIENFDGTSTWTNDHASKLFEDVNEPGQGLFVQPGASSLGPDNVLYGRDLNSETGEPQFNPVTITFDPVDVTSYTNVVFSFEYFLSTLVNDDIDYELTYTGGTNSGHFSDDDIGTETFDLPPGVTSVSLVLTLNQNGQNANFELDNFMLTGDLVPEPDGMILTLVGAALIGIVWNRHRRV